MAPLAPKLTIVPYLQTWNATDRELTVNVMVMPIDDPRAPLTDGWAGIPVPPGPAFQGSAIALEPHLSADLAHLPNRADVPGTGVAQPLTMVASQQQAIFEVFARTFDLSLPATPLVRSAATTLHKYLPRSYRRSFAFVSPRTQLAVTDDSYHCALRCPGRPVAPGTVSTRKLSWGDAFAMILRQPPVARAAGFIHTVTLDVDTLFEHGGWLFFTLHADSDFRAQFDADAAFARYFATRVPALVPDQARPVFSSAQFPVAADAVAASALGNFDPVYIEARRFDDGFAKIVHARQPLANDLSHDDDQKPELPPVTDAGIQLGWDDEDVVEGLNRAVGIYPDGSAPPEAPSGVAGYRVDVRDQGTTQWHSLCRIRATSFEVGDLVLEPFDTELRVEVCPSKLDGQFWLPVYLARWQGMSLVADTPDQRLLLGRPDDTPDLYEPLDADAVPLRYGRTYQFRVRLADATGGGPDWNETPVNPGDRPIGEWHLRRHVRPGLVAIEPIPPAPGAPPTEFRIRRPGIAYPQAAFADAPNALDRLAAIARAKLAGDVPPDTPVSVPDPDAEFLQITVMVRPPRFDTETDAMGWRTLYTTYRSFPAMASNGSASALTLTLDWIDCARLSDVAWDVPTRPPGTVDGPIEVPTARDLRIEVRAFGLENPAYWGERAHLGEPTTLTPEALHNIATTEAPLFAGNDPSQAIVSVFMQPEPARQASTLAAILQHVTSGVSTKRLATALHLMEESGTIFGPPGQRFLFGCTGLAHHLPPDSSSLLLTAPGELSRQWINVVRLSLGRDWTWRGLDTPSLRIRRIIELVPEGSTTASDLGSVSLLHTVNRQAVRTKPDREYTELVFVDAFVPPLASGLPYNLEVAYEVEAIFANGSTETFTVQNYLPVTTPPVQLPKVVSVGHAFSEYKVADDYAATEPRARQLWIEFATRPTDLRDGYYARVLASAPDPMLLPNNEPVSDPPGYADPPLDPEAIRIIRPGQADDFAGLAAMQRLIPAAHDPEGRFYLVPLPPNTTPDSKDLFGFFTYEFRVGHDRGTPINPFWSTAQGRFGPPLVVEGVQHPAPPLDCEASRVSDRIECVATFAQPVQRGRELTPRPPNTDLWFVLYARVVQADGATRRPIQLDARRAVVIRATRTRRGSSAAPPAGRAKWSTTELESLLRDWGLPGDTPLSALAVELLPEPNGRFLDPLGGDLSQVRILRTSPLVAIRDDCCP